MNQIKPIFFTAYGCSNCRLATWWIGGISRYCPNCDLEDGIHMLARCKSEAMPLWQTFYIKQKKYSFLKTPAFIQMHLDN